MARKSTSSPLQAWSLNYDQLAHKNNKQSDNVDAIVGFAGLKTPAKQDKSKAVKERSVSTTEIQVTKAWEAAYAPAKTIPMNLMMMWMSGNSVQIFSMMVVAMMIMNPLKGIMSMHGVFAPFRSPNHSLLPQMTAFVLCHLACMALGLYKCWSMGLLPTESSDWLAWYQPIRAHPLTPHLV
ncbi:hypothetical protein MEQU1_001888 [Malassezia equina]|uniref:ER membrane protein complex subunit 4 n=1 Tax=Malassezia equina TaxID=1381935 RepID=A0AAF0J3Q3_9BASI|nr:hypothetical protein MEQU1_001888 [Malassezia equina]